MRRGSIVYHREFVNHLRAARSFFENQTAFFYVAITSVHLWGLKSKSYGLSRWGRADHVTRTTFVGNCWRRMFQFFTQEDFDQ